MNYAQKLYVVAEEILKDLKITTKELAEEQRDDIEGSLHELAESAVIYTKDAYDIMLHTRNDDAYLELGDTLDTSKGASTIITQMAYWAYRADLEEKIMGAIEELPDTD